MSKLLNKNRQQLFRFFVSGIIASIINFLFYSFLYLIFNNLLIASICGYFTGLLISFIFAKIWVFEYRTNHRLIRSFSIFCLIYFVGGVLMSLIIVNLNRFIDNHRISWLFGAFFGSLNNYLASKYFLFRK